MSIGFLKVNTWLMVHFLTKHNKSLNLVPLVREINWCFHTTKINPYFQILFTHKKISAEIEKFLKVK